MKKSKALIGNLGIKAVEWFRAPATKAFKASRHFDPPADIRELGRMASDIVSLGNQTGEDALTGEMLSRDPTAERLTLCAPSPLPAFPTMW